MARVESLHPTKWSVYNPWLYKMIVPVTCFDPQIYWQFCQKWSNQCIHDLIKHIKIPEPFCRASILARPQRQLHLFSHVICYRLLLYVFQGLLVSRRNRPSRKYKNLPFCRDNLAVEYHFVKADMHCLHVATSFPWCHDVFEHQTREGQHGGISERRGNWNFV